MVIGYKAVGGVMQLNRVGFVYDNDFKTAAYRNPKGELVHIPEGKFNITG